MDSVNPNDERAELTRLLNDLLGQAPPIAEQVAEPPVKPVKVTKSRKPAPAQLEESSPHPGAPAPKSSEPPVQTITRVESNLKSPNAALWSFDLQPHVLITGHNGAGKSMIAEALQLALTGAVDDFNGRDDVRDPQDVFDAAPFGDADGTLSARAYAGETLMGEWDAEREGGTIHAPRAHSGVDARAMPMRAVRTLFRGDAKAARRTLLGWLGQATTIEDILAEIPEPLHALYRDIADARGKSPDVGPSQVARLAAVSDYARERARTVEAEAVAQERLVEQLSASLAAKPPDSEVAQARTALQQWQAIATQAHAYETWVNAQAGSTVEAEVARLRAGLVEAQTNAHAWETHAANLRRPGGFAVEALALASAAGVDHGRCGLCGTVVGAETLRAAVQFHEGVRAAGAEAEAAATTGRQWREMAQALEMQLQVAAQRLAVSSQGAPPVNPGPSAAQAAAEVNGWAATVERLASAASNWQVVTDARTRVHEARESKPKYEALAAACQKANDALLKRYKESFEAAVQARLPEGWRFELQLSRQVGDAVRETCKPVVHPANRLPGRVPSGVQRDALMVAMAMALAEAGGGEAVAAKGKKSRARKSTSAVAPYTLIVPEDRSRHPDDLAQLLRVWGTFEGQVIVTSAERPTGRIPAGWQHIDVDEWLAARQPTERMARSDDLTEVGDDDARREFEAKLSAGDRPTRAPALPPTAPAVAASEPAAPATGPEFDVLRALGYRPDAIGKMAPAARATVAQIGAGPGTVSVCNDGSVFLFSADGGAARKVNTDGTVTQ